mgnify:CR=1 FL=1
MNSLPEKLGVTATIFTLAAILSWVARDVPNMIQWHTPGYNPDLQHRPQYDQWGTLIEQGPEPETAEQPAPTHERAALHIVE